MTQNDPLSQWFAIPAFFVVFRETLEAVVLMAVMLQYLQRAGHDEMCRQVWMGGAAGGALAFMFGVIVLSIYYSAQQSLDTDIALIVEGIMLGSASVLISYFFVTHLAPGMKSDDQWKTKWERKMKQMIEEELETSGGGRRSNFFMLTLTNVFREGVEAVVFITGIGAMYTPEALVVPSIAGLIVGCLMGVMMFVGSKKLDLSGFFIFSAVLLLFIAAGLASHASYEFQKAGVFGPWACYNCGDDITDDLPSGYRRLAGDDDESCGDDIPSWNSYRRLESTEEVFRRLDTGRSASCDGVAGRNVPWVNREVYDITGCCDTSNMFFFLMMVLFWYRPAPSNLEVVVYCLYWPCVFFWGVAKVRAIKEFNETLLVPVDETDEEDPTVLKLGASSTVGQECKEAPAVELVAVPLSQEEESVL